MSQMENAKVQNKKAKCKNFAKILTYFKYRSFVFFLYFICELRKKQYLCKIIITIIIMAIIIFAYEIL